MHSRHELSENYRLSNTNPTKHQWTTPGVPVGYATSVLKWKKKYHTVEAVRNPIEIS